MHRLSRLALTAVGALASSVAFAAPLPNPLPCSACFIGEIRLALNPADASGRTKIVQDDVYFVDPDKLVWKADKGDITDGASIPAIFQPIIGNAFENDFLPAAIIHDHYTTKEHYVRTWKATALMFYQAMVVKNVPAIKAKTMYYAVYTFGPHWGTLVVGHNCGHGCINMAPDPAKQNQQFVTQAADYAPDKAPEIQAVQDTIAAAELSGRPLSINDLNKLALAKHAKDAFIDPVPLPNSQ